MTTVHSLSDFDATPHANVFPDSEPKTIRLTLEADERVDPHEHPGREIVLYLVEGAIELRVGDETLEVTDGDVARFDGAQEISPVATEHSTALIVLAPVSGEEMPQ